MPRLGPLLAALALTPTLGCSLLVDLEALSEGGGAAGGAGPGAGGAGPGAGGAGPGGAPGTITFTDDELAGEFGEGTFNGAAWTGSRVELASGSSAGELTSRVLDAGSTSAAWQALSWTPGGPYGKALPDQGATEAGYEQGSADMRDNVLLLHLDGGGPLEDFDEVLDSSGRFNDATVSSFGGEKLPLVPGRFGQAIEDTSGTYLYVDTALTDDFQLGTSDFTWALWVRTTESCVSNRVYLGVEDVGVDRAHLWLGCTDGLLNMNCPSGDAGGRAGGTFRSQHDADDGGNLCGQTRINDGAWHHLAVVKEGHPNATLTLYVDGEEEDVTAGIFVAPIELFDAPELAIGAFSTGTYQASGAFDEVAIWRRALASNEVRSLHRRGVFRLSLQVRTCDDAACVQGGAFAGPGLDGAAWFVEPASALGPGTPVALDGVPLARFLQYKARLESDVAGLSPGLLSVSVTARP